MTEGPVGRRLVLLTLPMIAGMFSMVAFHLADTYFVGQLGKDALAAIGFTFPVIFFIVSIALGLGMGAGSVISRAVGQGDEGEVRRLCTDGLRLALAVVILFSLAGILTIRPLFRLLGATEDLLPMIEDYMTVWYLGMIFVVVPMVGNNAIRAAGDTLFPGLIMATGAGLNLLFDPLFIFGWGPFPRLELQGAAAATVCGRALTALFSLGVLHWRERMLDFRLPPLRTIWNSWRQILHIGVPTAGTNVLVPITMAVIVRMVADYGKAAVAGTGVGVRVQGFALLVLMALGTILLPFIGQNWGAGRYDRVRLALRYAHGFSLAWGLLCVGVFWAAAPPVASLFSENVEVLGAIVLYLWIVPVGYGPQAVHRLTCNAFNGMGMPLRSAGLNLLRLFVLYLPLAWAGSWLLGLQGLFGGLTLANLIGGSVAMLWMGRVLRRQEAGELDGVGDVATVRKPDGPDAAA
jgi:putative MATE family efflux protein